MKLDFTTVHINAVISIVLLFIIQIVILVIDTGQLVKSALAGGCGIELPFVFAPIIGIVAVAKIFAGQSNGNEE